MLLNEKWLERQPLPVEPESGLPSAPQGKVAWTNVRVWLYQAGTAQEITAQRALSALGAWRSGRAIARVSFVVRARVVSDPDQVDWEDFPKDEALEAEGEAPVPRPPVGKTSVSPRTSKPQMDALRAIDEAPEGLCRDAVHFRRARALLDRGLIEVSLLEGRSMLRSSRKGRTLIRRADMLVLRSKDARSEDAS